MSFENQKWSENAPEVISEGLKFKKFLGGGDAPRPPYRVRCRVQSLCPHQILPKYYFAPLVQMKRCQLTSNPKI